MSINIEELRNKWEKANQGHVFTFFEQLSEEKKKELVEQLNKIDLVQVEGMFKTCENIAKVQVEENNQITPLPLVTKIKNSEQKQHWEKIGFSAIYSNKVAVILLAGGQGTRLGYDHPKGMFSIGLPSNKTIFQIQAERMRKLVCLSNENERKKNENAEENAKIFWYIMTSDATHDETKNFFEENHFFGFNQDEISFFKQSTLPATSPDGALLLFSPSSVSILFI